METVGLDPYVGFFHTDRPGRMSLALDIMEELRGVMADWFVLTLINKKQIKPEGFIKKESGAVIMDDDSRKQFLTAWQAKKQEVITHPFLNGEWYPIRRRYCLLVLFAGIWMHIRRFYGSKG